MQYAQVSPAQPPHTSPRLTHPCAETSRAPALWCDQSGMAQPVMAQPVVAQAVVAQPVVAQAVAPPALPYPSATAAASADPIKRF